MKRYSVTGLEGRNAKSKCNHGHASSRSTGKRPFFASSSLACQCSRRCAWTSPVAARVTFWFLFLFSCPVVSDFVTLWTAACQASLSLTISQICPSSCPLHGWCHPPISSFDAPFSCPQSFPTSGTFPMSLLFASHDQNTGVSTSASVFPMNIQDWFPLGWTSWISLCPRDSQESSPTPQLKSINSLALSFLHSPTLTSIHDHWKNHSLD